MSTNPEKFRFPTVTFDRRNVDFMSSTWTTVRQYAEERIEECRKRMEDLTITNDDRREQAARIAELRALIGKESAATPSKLATAVDYSPRDRTT